MEDQLMQDNLERTARKDFSKVGLVMVAATLLFLGVQYLAVYVYSAVSLMLSKGASAGGIGSYGVRVWVQLVPTYLFTMPLIIFLLGRLPGVKPQKKKITFWQFLGALACCFGIMITCNLLGLAVTAVIGRLAGITVENVSADLVAGLDPLASLLLASLAAPVFEELIFRKMLVTRTLKYGEGAAILLSGLMFGLFHGNFNQFAYTFGLGMFLAYLFVKTGDVKITIGIHVIINFSSSVILGGLLSKLDVEGLLRASKQMQQMGNLTEEAMAQLAAFLEASAVVLLALFFFLIFEYGMALTGVILLIVSRRKFRLSPGEVTIARGRRFAVIFGNVGMILFLLIWLVRIVLQFFGL